MNIHGIEVDFSRWLEKEREDARQLEEQKAEAIHHLKGFLGTGVLPLFYDLNLRLFFCPSVS